MKHTGEAIVKPEAGSPRESPRNDTPPSAAITAPSQPVPVKSAISSISGRPLSEIMSGAVSAETPAEKEETATPIDRDAQEKIERHREKFLERLGRERPRIGVAFETMEVAGNALRVRVASKTLHDEILRWRTETLGLLATVAGVHGPIELEVIVDETVRPTRPIRIEDKLRHLAELNPEFNALRKTLDMEAE